MWVLKNSLEHSNTSRIKKNTTATSNGGKQLSLIMDQPNESDLGLPLGLIKIIILD